jgi:hypothetical protein
MTGSQQRPGAIDPAQLGFRPQRSVRWLAPRELGRVAVKVALSAAFGAYADKRELQAVFHATVPDLSPRAELWFDYVSDVGDSFDATYTVAWLLAQEQLDVGPAGGAAGDGLPRGSLLVLGGDEVYPSASSQEYEDRTTGPYQAAFPRTDTAPPPTLCALPGNHDWYDGLTAFLRVFAQGATIGGWQTRQTRSYFAVQLPHRWWLFGIDVQFDTYIDAGQLRYFNEACSQMQPGDGVILCSARPSWRHTALDPDAFATLDFFERHVIRPTGAAVRLWLSGDDHHYARYGEVNGDRQLITCGTGGAYTSGTHRLPVDLELPPPESRSRHKTSPPAHYRLASTSPGRARSARLAALGVWRLPLRNPSFLFFLGLGHMFLLLSLLSALSTLPWAAGGLANALFGASVAETVKALARPWALLSAGVLIAGTMGMSYQPKRRHLLVLGALHGLAQVTLGVVALLAWAQVPALDRLPDVTVILLVCAGTLTVTGFVASELVAAYLLLASLVDLNVNELFSAQRLKDDKGFLRLHIGTDGVLTVHPVGVNRSCRTWAVDPEGAPHSPWIKPADGPPAPHLIEPPIRIARDPAGVAPE